MVSLALALVGLIVGVVAEGIATNRSFSSIRSRPGRAPLVAVITAALFGLTPLAVDVDWVLPAYLWFVAVTVTLTLTDIDAKLIPNRILVPGTAVALVLLIGGAVIEDGPIVRPLAGGAIYFALLLVLASWWFGRRPG